MRVPFDTVLIIVALNSGKRNEEFVPLPRLIQNHWTLSESIVNYGTLRYYGI